MKISDKEPKNTSQQGISDKLPIEKRMKEKGRQITEFDAEVYVPTQKNQ